MKSFAQARELVRCASDGSSNKTKRQRCNVIGQARLQVNEARAKLESMMVTRV
jgi:hypothetical protein